MKLHNIGHQENTSRVLPFSNIFYLLSGQFIASTVSHIFDVVLVWYALDLSKNYKTVGAIIFLRFVPYALFGLISGWLADCIDRRRLIIFSDIFRGLVLMTTAASITLGTDPLVALAWTAFFLTGARTLFQPAVQGLIPYLSGKGRIVQTNALLYGGHEVIGVCAPILAGFILLVFSLPFILTSIAAGFILSSGLTRLIKIERAPHRSLVLKSFFAGYVTLFHTLLHSHRIVFIALLSNAGAVLGVGGVLSFLIPTLVKDHYHKGPETLGLLMGMMSAGSILGSWSATQQNEHRWMVGMYVSWVAYGFLLAFMGTPSTITYIVLIALPLGMVGAMADVLFASFVQARMSNSDVSKTFAVFSTLANTFQAVSAPLLALSITTFGLQFSFALGGSIALLSSFLGLILSLTLR